MVTLKHEISSDMEYEYADHTISERPGPARKAGIAQDPRQEQPPPPPGYDNGQPQRPKSRFQELIESMTPAGRREYAGELDNHIQQILNQSCEPGRIAGQDYELQLRLLELQNSKRTLKQRIEQDAREGVVDSTSVRPPPTLKYTYQEQLELLEAQGKKKYQIARLEQAWMESLDLNRNQILAGHGKSQQTDPNGTSSILDHPQTFQPGNHALRDYQLQLMLQDMNGSRTRDAFRANFAAATAAQGNIPVRCDQHSAPPCIQIPPLDVVDQPTPSWSSNEVPGPHSLDNSNAAGNPLPPVYQPREQPWVSGPSNRLSGYKKELILLDQINKKRVMQARQEREQDAGRMDPPEVKQESYKTSSWLIEQTNKERERQEQDSMMGTFRVDPQYMGQQDSTMGTFHVNPQGRRQQDYQMQLMLLEQQNKRRLTMARQNYGPGSTPEPGSYLPGSPGTTCSPAPSSVIFTPESSVAPSSPPSTLHSSSALENVLDFARPMEIRGPAPANAGTKRSYPTELEL